MISPIDNDGFKHELKFYDFGMAWYEIPEPIGFDGAKFVMKQDKSWARDVTYFAIDGLTFPRQLSDRLSTPRQINPQGDFCDYLDYGIEWLLANRREKGSEMKVGYRVSVGGVVFREFELDTRDDAFTDGKDWFKCKLIEIGLVADHKRNAKNTFNAFSDKNWKDETITPIESFNYLVKATGARNTSIFKSTGETQFCQAFINGSGGSAPIFINKIKNIEESNIDNALIWLEDVSRLEFSSDSYQPDPTQFTIIKAKKNILSLKAKITLNLDLNLYDNNGSPIDNRNQFRLFFFKGNSGGWVDNWGGITNSIWESNVLGTDTNVFSQEVRTVIDIELNDIFIGGRIFFGFTFNSNSSFPIYTINYLDSKIELLSEELGLNTVATAVRYSDLLLQSGKFVNPLPFVMTDFSDGGKYYDQAVFNKKGISKVKEIFSTPDMIFAQLQEVCQDIEFSQENIQIRHRSGYYENTEIASFLVIPSEDYAEPFNEEYLINNYQFGYKSFEQEKSVKGTSFGVHTSSEWLPRNERREDSKKIEVPFVRDFLEKSTMVELEINKPTTSTDKDEKLFIEDMVRVPPNATNTFFSKLLMRWVNNKLEILNIDENGESGESILNWNKIGLEVGSFFKIELGANIGSYIVFYINEKGSIVTLTPTTIIVRQNGSFQIKITHNYINVLWQTATDEGFSIAPPYYSNLRYTIKRNIFEWYDYLATAVLYAKKDIKNSFFKNFGKLETQLDSETTPVIEDAPILYDDLPTPIVEPILIKSTILAPYNDVVQYLENYKTVKGFIRIYTPDGDVRRVYPNMFEYAIATAQADIQGEKKYQSEFLKIDTTDNGIFVDDAFYNMQGIAKWFITKNNYIQLYDKKSNPLSNFYRYDFVILNGIHYNSINELVIQLNLVEWT